MSIIDDKWKLLFDRYDIEKKVSESRPLLYYRPIRFVSIKSRG